MRVGVVGATGQVGTVMRSMLAERNFPVTEMRFFASARSAGTTLPWAGDGRSPSKTPPLADPAGLDIALFSAGATSSRELSPRFAAAGVLGHRQLVGLSHGPRRAAHRQRGQRARDRPRPQGHHRQPELHHDGGDAGAQAVARRSRIWSASIASTYQAVSGAGSAGCRRTRQAGARGRRSGARVHSRRQRRSSCPRRRSSPSRSRSMCCRLPASSSTTDRFETDEEQKLRNESRKILDIPDLKVSGYVCTRTRLHRPQPQHQRRVRATDQCRSGDRGARCRTRRAVVRRADPTRSRRAGPGFVGRIRRTRPSTAGGGWCCSSATTTCAREPRSTRSRSPSWSVASRDELAHGIHAHAHGRAAQRGHPAA